MLVHLIGSGTLAAEFPPSNPQTTTYTKRKWVKAWVMVWTASSKANLERVQVTVGPHEIDLLEAEVAAITLARA